MLVLNIALLIAGFIVLIKCADIFVDSASDVAIHFNLSKMFIGLTIVSFGTSAPEFAVSVKSIISGSGDIVLGNVIGSNILNILLILGVSSLVHSLAVKDNTVKKEIPITLLLTSLLIVVLGDSLFDRGTNSFTRGDGIVILLCFSIFIYYLFTQMKNKIKDDDEPKHGLLLSFVLTIISIIGIIVGSNFVVESSSYIASTLGVSEKMIALTIVALGTSLPELVTSIVATKKGSYDIAIGNVVGSNIFNIGIVLGVPVTLFGGFNNYSINMVDLMALLTATILLLLCAFTGYKIEKKEGILFILVFIIYYSYVIFI